MIVACVEFHGSKGLHVFRVEGLLEICMCIIYLSGVLVRCGPKNKQQQGTCV